MHLVLPLAISFFTFQQISYLVDSYKGGTKEYDFLNYSLFVTFFPQLIAGPIVHHKEMMPQFADKSNSKINYNNIAKGLFIFSIGLFKKTVIADTFATWANAGFDTHATLNFIEAWATSFTYSFQLYFDFSGYTDMAIGLALLFNIVLPINFFSPYKATSIQDFWRRWHITLSRFLRDYIYIPLGGSREGKFRTYGNLMATFILGGFWHGAGWTFLFWGFLHGIALCLHRVWQALGFKLWTWLAILVTFIFVDITWVFFRAKSWDRALSILHSMFDLSNIVLPERVEAKLGFLSSYGIHFGNWTNIGGSAKMLILAIIFGLILTFMFKNSMEMIDRFKLNYGTLLLTAFCLALSFLNMYKVSNFLYFNF